ncbi:DUF2529 family protein [Salipaludibacillus sp. HK11]|uniref:DUF2529 family protein n=1 Tax=Salipaludibacillus sp. HK11 TaxID=3394320 RepID=UPI0039FC5539
MKIFTTQTQGLVDKLAQYEEDLEDAARVIAQSIISDGKIFWYGEHELKGVVSQACVGEDKWKGSLRADEETTFSKMDTFIVATRNLSGAVISSLIERASEVGANVIAIYSNKESVKEFNLFEKVDFSFCTGVVHGLVPMESGQKIGRPHLLVALQLYYQLYFSVMEILEEHDELD